MASVCTGAFFLAEAGLLSRRRATSHPLFAEVFRRSYPDVQLVPEERMVDGGSVLTAGSTTSFLELAIYLIDRFASHELAVLTAKTLSMDLSHRSQLPYFLFVAAKDHGDDEVSSLQSWLEKHHTRPVAMSQLARRGAMSQRSLNRRFLSATGMAPVNYLHRLRIESAKHLLETSQLSIDQITSKVGYENARSFSRLFKSRVGLAPRQYRARFSSAP
jgi:transcriptional regulator GlxA family with amidase domain